MNPPFPNGHPPQYPDDPGAMYAQQYHYQYSEHHPPVSGPPPQYMQHHPMHDGMEHAPPPPAGSSRLPALHVTHVTPSKLRARRQPGEAREALEVTAIPYGGDRMSPGMSPGFGGPVLKSTIRAKTVEDDEARKARKREMGRERQRRKRLRDKQKREAAAKAAFGEDHLERNASRNSIVSTSSYEGIPSSASTTYSTLPPMSMTISPSTSFMSHSTSMSDVSSPGQSLSPTMTGFTSDSSWQEHTAVFGNLTLTGDGTVRAKPRATSATLSSVGPSRRPSEPDYNPFGMSESYGPSPAKRRKSDTEDSQYPAQVGLGVIIGPDGEGWSERPVPPRRTASVPDGFDAMPSRSPSPDPKPTPDGMLFSSVVVSALSQDQYMPLLQSKLGMTKNDLERMTPNLAHAFERYRRTKAASSSGGRSSPPTSPRPSTFTTPSTSRTQDQKSPSSGSANSLSSMPALRSAIQMTAPETPSQTPQKATSTATSPTGPTLQTPHAFDYPQWQQPLQTRMYDDWRAGTGYLASPIGDKVVIPPPPAHQPPVPQPALQSPMTVQQQGYEQYPRMPYQAQRPGVQIMYPHAQPGMLQPVQSPSVGVRDEVYYAQ